MSRPRDAPTPPDAQATTAPARSTTARTPRPARTPDSSMRPTDVSDPQHYHRVVDCQWACPAHTNVPEYIRLIAQCRYTDAYMLHRRSNVFPVHPGRTFHLPLEPASRPTRPTQD